MDGRGAIGAALIKMATSPVKADREAIAKSTDQKLLQQGYFGQGLLGLLQCFCVPP
jgi:hypothetical protein